MNLRKFFVAALLSSLMSSVVTAQSTACRDAAEEPHHRVILETSAFRVLVLELPRIASTDAYCYASPYIYIVLGEGRSSTTADGQGTMSRDWIGSETHLVYQPQKQVVRNESGRILREVIVELPRLEQYDPRYDNAANDMFPSDLGSVKPTWAVSFTKGGVSVSKVQLGAGASMPLNSAGHVLIALNDLSLRRKVSNAAEEISSGSQEVNVLPSNRTSELTNVGRGAARFILIEY